VYVAALRRAYHQSRKSYRLSVRFTILELILNRNRPDSLIRRIRRRRRRKKRKEGGEREKEEQKKKQKKDQSDSFDSKPISHRKFSAL
jgi:formylmethanofuran dehydrogenase subunit E